MSHKSSGHVRLICNLIIITLSLISLILLRLEQSFFWLYTILMSVVIALISVGQGVYLSFKEKRNPRRSLWHQILYWAGTLGAIYIVTLMLHYGVASKIQSGLVVLLILALVLYLTGVAEDLSQTLVGLTLALMVSGTILIRPYFLLVIIPVAIIMAILIVLLIRHRKYD